LFILAFIFYGVVDIDKPLELIASILQVSLTLFFSFFFSFFFFLYIKEY